MELTTYNYSIWMSTGSAREVFRRFEETGDRPDVMILDVRLKEKIDGIALIDQLEDRIPFLFLTAFPEEEQFQRALKTGPAAYFIKPIKGIELHHAIQLALNMGSPQGESNHGDRQEIGAHDCLNLRDKDNYLHNIPISDIHAVESYGNFLFFHTVNNRYLLRRTMKEMEGDLRPYNFMRIHRRYLISLKHWERKWPLGTYVMVDGQKYPIGRAYRKDLQRLLES